MGVHRPVPAITSAMVATVENITNRPVGSATISTTRTTANSRKMPAHSQVRRLLDLTGMAGVFCVSASVEEAAAAAGWPRGAGRHVARDPALA
jgi:hypothetical protein